MFAYKVAPYFILNHGLKFYILVAAIFVVTEACHMTVLSRLGHLTTGFRQNLSLHCAFPDVARGF